MCKDGDRCTRPVCFFVHNAAQLRAISYPSLNEAQLAVLFSARASLAEADDAALRAARSQPYHRTRISRRRRRHTLLLPLPLPRASLPTSSS